MQKNKPEEDALFRATVGRIRPLKKPPKVRESEKPVRQKRPKIKESALSLPSPLALSDSYTETLTPEKTVYYLAEGVSLEPQLLQKIRRGEYLLECSLDLHGETVDGARDKFSSILQQAYQEQHRGVLIIHGKGRNAILKNHVIHWLKQIPWVLFFCSAQSKDGGAGSLYVLLKRKKPPVPQNARSNVGANNIRPNPIGTETKNDLDKVRKKIDVLDNTIVTLLCERFSYAKKAAELKKTTQLDSTREQKILTRVSKQANELGIPGELVEIIYQTILDQMRKHQTNATMEKNLS